MQTCTHTHRGRDVEQHRPLTVQIKHLLAVNVTPAVTSAQNEVRKISGEKQPTCSFPPAGCCFFLSHWPAGCIIYSSDPLLFSSYSRSPFSSLISPSLPFLLSLHPNQFFSFCRVCQRRSVAILLFSSSVPLSYSSLYPCPPSSPWPSIHQGVTARTPFARREATALAEAQTITPSVGGAPYRQGRARPSRSTLPPCHLISDTQRPATQEADSEATSGRDVHWHLQAADVSSGRDTTNLRTS